jgi:Na+-transporting NADH:ubiquinone oxidoreductase subunit F
MGVKEWECTVIGNRNVATFIKEYKVALPPGEHMDFEPGSYAQIKIPAFSIDYDKDFDKSLIGDTYLPAWKNFGLFNLKCVNDTPTIRAYSMANYPDEGDIITLNVRIATPPFKPKEQGGGFMDVNPGIASSYIFSLKPGDKVIMSGPYGEFRPQYGTGREMIWVGGGAGMAPLRAQIMHMLKTLNTRDREMHYFYGARALEEIPFLDDFLALEKEFDNFHFHLALDRPDPKADAAGIKYTPGFVAPVMGDTYLKQHENPEDVEYYLCGPPMMAKTVLDLLHSLGVEVLMSTHTHTFFDEETVMKIAKSQQERGADVVKIVNFSNTEEQMLENIRICTNLKHNISKNYLFLTGGTYGRFLRHAGPSLGCCMYLCVQQYKPGYSTEQPKLTAIKQVRDNFIL